MKKFYSIQDILQKKDSTFFIREDEEYKQYVFSTLSLFRKKITEGSLFDCERIAKQVQEILSNKNRFSPSPLLLSQVYICLLELYLKKKSEDKYYQYYQISEKNLQSLKKQQLQQQLMKLNSLVLYDHDFEVMYQQEPNYCVIAVESYKQRRIQEAVQCLKLYLNEYEPYVVIKKVLIGRMLLELSNIEAFEWLEQVINIKEPRQYEKYQAKILFISGYKALVEKFGIDLKKIKIENIEEKQKLYTQQLKSTQSLCSRSKIEEFKSQYALGFSKKLSSQERKAHLQKSLQLIKGLPCYPSPSIYEYDIRIKFIEECVQTGDFQKGKENAQIVIGLGNKMNVFNWSRQLKVNKALAKVLEHEQNTQGAVQLIDRCVQIQSSPSKKEQLQKWKVSLSEKSLEKSKIPDKNSSKKKIASTSQTPIQRLVHGKATVFAQNKNLNESQVQLVGQGNNKPPEKQQKSCCLLI